jgi:ribonucleoside-diphosphate reductase alpha chain
LRYIELNNMITQRGKDGFFQLDKDRLAVIEFMADVERRMIRFNSVQERMRYLIGNDYYEDVYSLYGYTEEEVEKLHKIAYDYHFTFASFMAASKFFNDYALKTNDKKHYLEGLPEHNVIVALHLAKGNFKKAERYLRAMMEQRYQPATPTYLNAGRSRRGELVSCFLLVMDDSQNSIQYNLNCMAYLSKIGGGVAADLSNLRALGDPIKEVENAAKGVMPVLKLMEDTFSYYDQMGQRKGSGAGYINIFHLDSNMVLDSKKINADEKIRLKTLSIGLIIPNIFYELAERDEDLYVFSPYDIRKYYGLRMTDVDFDEMYYTFVRDERIRKVNLMPARDMLNKIAMTQMESGYPYIMNITNANKQHPLKGIGRILLSNLCTEIFQLMEVSEIMDYDFEDLIGRDISCNLGSINVVNVMETKKIRQTIHEGVEALTSVSDESSVTNAPGVRKANEELHSIGLGAMNLHGYLAKNHISYESKEARDFCRTFFMMMNFYSLEKSMLIAKERRKTFKDFEKSEYANGRYFRKYLKNNYAPKTERVKQLFEGIYIPTPEDWYNLMLQVQKYGLYHAYRLAIAPTQSISYVQNATSSVMPIVDQIETRTYANSKTFYPAPYMNKENFWFYKSAYNTNMYRLIDLIAVIQEHVDQGISTILYVNSDISTADLAKYYIYAAKKGLKSLYYTRTRKTDINECVACAV